MTPDQITKLKAKFPAVQLENGNLRVLARLSFPSLFEKSSFEGSEPKYSAVLLMPLGYDIKPLMAAASAAIKAEWGDKAKGMTLHNPFRDQGIKSLAGYVKGAVFITASTKQKPPVVDHRKTAITDPEDVYAGCWVLATVRPFTFDAKAKKGVSFGLQSVMKIADDEPFSGSADPDADFGDVEVDASMSGDAAFNGAGNGAEQPDPFGFG